MRYIFLTLLLTGCIQAPSSTKGEEGKECTVDGRRVIIIYRWTRDDYEVLFENNRTTTLPVNMINCK